MEIYIDTADINQIKKADSWGIVKGITTNPSLIKKGYNKHEEDFNDMHQYISEIMNIAGHRPVSLEVISTNAEDMVDEATTLQDKFSSNGVIKIPINPNPEKEGEKYEGVKAISDLKVGAAPSTNATLVMTPGQALLAAEAGADYVSPFAGRIDDYLRTRVLGLTRGDEFEKTDYWPADGDVTKIEGIRGAIHFWEKTGTRRTVQDKDGVTLGWKDPKIIHDKGITSGVDLVDKTVDALKGYDTEVIAASIRNARQVEEVALAGADIATIPFPVLEDILVHKKTQEGAQSFLEDVISEYEMLFN